MLNREAREIAWKVLQILAKKETRKHRISCAKLCQDLSHPVCNSFLLFLGDNDNVEYSFQLTFARAPAFLASHSFILSFFPSPWRCILFPEGRF